MKNIFCLLTFSFCLSGAFGQDYKKIDSLKQVLTTLPEMKGNEKDSSLLQIYIEIGNQFRKSVSDSALYWYNKATETASKQKRASENNTLLNLNAYALYQMALIYKAQNDYEKTIEYFEKLLMIKTRISDYDGMIYCYSNIASAQNKQYNYNSAVESLQKALQLSEFIANKKYISACYSGIGINLYYWGKYKEAADFYLKSLKIDEELGDYRGISLTLINLGTVSNQQGNYERASYCFTTALEYSSALDNKDIIIAAYIGLGLTNMPQSNYKEAENNFKKALEISVSINDKANIAGALTNLGIVSKKLGNFPEAFFYYEKGLKISEEINDLRSISNCLSGLGGLYNDIGNLEESIGFYKKGMQISELLNDKSDISSALTNIGIVLQDLYRFSEAEEYYKRALAIGEETGSKSSIATNLTNLGNVTLSMGNYTKALEYYKMALELNRENKNQDGMYYCLYNIGVLSKLNGDTKMSIDFLSQAIAISEKIGSAADLAKDYRIIAKSYSKEGNYSDAFTLLKKSRNLTINLLSENFTVLTETDKENYLGQLKDIFDDMHYFNMRTRSNTDSLKGLCYNNELVIKGLLLNSTQKVLDYINSSNDTLIKIEYAKLKKYREKIVSLQYSDRDGTDSLIPFYNDEVKKIERNLVKLSPVLEDLKTLFSVSWKDVQNSLKQGEAAIEFFSYNTGEMTDTLSYSALIITKECTEPLSFDLFNKYQINAVIGNNTETEYNSINYIYGKNSTTLYNLIWKPLEPTLAGITTVYYAPVGVLNKISFAALSKEPGKMLCDIYNLQQVTTTGKLINKEDAKEMKMTAAVFGGIDYNTDTAKLEAWQYLPGTLNEKNSIEKQLKKNKISCHTFSGKEAKEETFKALFDSSDAPSILHVSTHGFFYPDPETTKKDTVKDEKNETGQLAFRGSSGFGNWMFLNNKNPMMRSGLVFAGANRVWSEDWGRTDNEGVLTAYEVSNMNMRNTNLVVLSACETGLGDIRGSEGVYGLQRAFKMAGVKYIIMSLWQVPDKETVEFMETFYKKLLKSKDVRNSFNETQKEMRKKYDPYYWAAFVLIE